MQILIHALCTKGGSLREAIANDSRLGRYELEILREKQPGRAPGWMKIRSAGETPGVLNIEWHPQTSVLSARVVTRGSKASPIVGDFVNYLLRQHSRRVRTIITAKAQ
ncbi:MAG: hypothetical protein H0U66_07410 [Gemmatimonadaceae bacterium]|nr:hypothetical protein [Gemmatimonadaceae bacterium]